MREFRDQALGTGDKGVDTTLKADYLARGFGNLPARMRNEVLLRLGDSGALEWMGHCRYGSEPAILGGISDSAVGRVAGLGTIRSQLRSAFLEKVRATRPRYIVNAYLAFAHSQSGEFRDRLYRAILDALRLYAADESQEVATCRALLEIALSVGLRGPVWILSQSLAAVNAEGATDGAIRTAHRLVAVSLDRTQLTPDAVTVAVPRLPELVEKDALVARTVSWAAASGPLDDETERVLSAVNDRASFIIRSHRKHTPNAIDQFLSAKGAMD